MAMAPTVKSRMLEIEADLIEEVKKKPYLWDIKHPYYTKKTLKKVGYEEIAENMKERWPEYAGKFQYDLMLAKFKNLRSQYRRERKRMLTFKSGSGGQGFVPKWEHFQRLSFLDDGTMAEDSCSNLDNSFSSNIIHDEVKEEEECTEQPSPAISQNFIFSESLLDVSEPSPSPSTSTKPAERKKGKREDSDIQDFLSTASAALLKVQETENNTEVLFGKYVASSLLDISNLWKRELLKMKIQKLIFKAKFS
ncbi:uncharacterized protein LOC118205825 [Stegodyphus dumicola]|uniref:uncharacterized protein LOC118205825 n=1 Tax=Stegodyphus dumicola TaxID=202533 RepID=UPI0015B28FAB|nr:uncharacterized protein LOC118205825 [Stegodyphus dumicola]